MSFKDLTNGLLHVEEEIKQRIKPKPSKVNQFESRCTQCRQNRLFRNDQLRLYQEIDTQTE